MAREPAWWYAPADWRASALSPLAAIVAAAAVRRLARGAESAYHSALPVICVGNFTAGGTGKTPLVIAVVERLRALGLAPVVLSRGYGGRTPGPHLVDRQRDCARSVGDEPLLLATHAPIMIARDRAAGARAIEALALPAAGAIVMDDGMQNPGLAKRLTLAVVDGLRGIGNGRTMPAGPLRAPLQAQLGLADAIVVNAPAGVEPETAAQTADQLRRTFDGPVLAAVTGPATDLGLAHAGPLVAFAGIGAPDRFFRMLEALGGVVVARHAFPDHHAYREADAQRLLAIARSAGATLITTEKDHVRLARGEGALSALANAARTVPVRLSLAPRDEERLLSLLRASIVARPATPPP